MKPIVIERHENAFGRFATVELDGKKYFCAVERGKMVRIPYKPRGSNHGWKWHGVVRNAKGSKIWSGYVSKSTGVPSLLRYAGLLTYALCPVCQDSACETKSERCGK